MFKPIWSTFCECNISPFWVACWDIYFCVWLSIGWIPSMISLFVAPAELWWPALFSLGQWTLAQAHVGVPYDI